MILDVELQSVKDYSSIPDIQIIKEIIDGNKDLFAEILRRYESPILRYTNRLLSFNQQDAEDVTAESFVKAYLNLAGYNPNLQFSSWLYRIAHNEAVNLIKKKSKYSITDIDNLQIKAEITENLLFEKKEIIENILNKVNIEDRNILILFYLEERTIAEISETLKISPNNVAVKLNRARNRARNLI
jgi:RNA polymerase sigma-70 factor, ECF subfamily